MEFDGRKKCVDEAAHEEREQKRADRGKRQGHKKEGPSRALNKDIPEDFLTVRELDLEEWKLLKMKDWDGHLTNT